MSRFATTDLCDAHEDRLNDGRLRVLALPWRSLGGLVAFSGPISTVSIFEDNVLLRRALSAPGHGGVLVVDAGESLRRAVLGDQIARLALENHWSGVVIAGAVRDAAVLAGLPLGILALGTSPRKSAKAGAGSSGESVWLRGSPVRPGEWLYADADGVLVSSEALPLPEAV
jgi:regulator of ribonuclease activity A